jgi:hypothetical protein
MVKSIEKVFTFFVVLVLILLLIELLGGFIAGSVEPAANRVSEILHNMWVGIQNIAHTGTYGHYGH